MVVVYAVLLAIPGGIVAAGLPLAADVVVLSPSQVELTTPGQGRVAAKQVGQATATRRPSSPLARNRSSPA